MYKRMILLSFAFGASGAAIAQENSYTCTHGELTRRVVIMSEPGVSVPCEVQYFKDTEAPGESQVLWSAQNQEGFCEQKSSEFVASLEGWGWSCSSAAVEPDAPMEEEDVRDDTEDLMPSEPELE